MASTYDLMANNGGYIYINGEMSGKLTFDAITAIAEELNQ